MKTDEFIQWLKGYIDGVHAYSASPKQWQYLKEKVKSIVEEEEEGVNEKVMYLEQDLNGPSSTWKLASLTAVNNWENNSTALSKEYTFKSDK
jgi:hypothetical protein